MTFDEWWETTGVRTGNESERELAEFAWNAAISARPEELPMEITAQGEGEYYRGYRNGWNDCLKLARERGRR